MRFRTVLLLVPFIAAVVEAAGPAEAVAAAAADLAKQPVRTRPYLRYLSLYATPEKDRKPLSVVVDFWLNSLSSEADLARADRVGVDLLRIDVRNYGTAFGKAWEKLSTREVYFYKTSRRRGLISGVPRKWGIIKTPASAPWLDAKDAAALNAGTESLSPIVRADWWLVETSYQEGREGTGYFDFLGIVDRKTFQALGGFDEALSKKFQLEMRAAVRRGGPTIEARGIAWMKAITGSYWFTLDNEKGKGKGAGNPLVKLNGDHVHQAEEVYLRAPNGLWKFGMFNAQGVLQKSVPTKIASDSTSPSNDPEIHPVGCVRCHLEGIRPINDWIRAVENQQREVPKNKDFDEESRRIRRLYQSNLERQVKRDNDEYTEVLFGLTALKPPELAKAFAKSHRDYEMADLFLADLARETGYPAPKIATVLANVAKFTPPLLPLFSGLIAKKPQALRREHSEEGFPILMEHLTGYGPAKEKR